MEIKTWTNTYSLKKGYYMYVTFNRPGIAGAGAYGTNSDSTVIKFAGPRANQDGWRLGISNKANKTVEIRYGYSYLSGSDADVTKPEVDVKEFKEDSTG